MEPVIAEQDVAAFARDGVACGAPGFPYPSRRRVLSLRYLAPEARHAPRPWRTSPPFDGLQAELPAGAPMDHPLFPVAWPPDTGSARRSRLASGGADLVLAFPDAGSREARREARSPSLRPS